MQVFTVGHSNHDFATFLGLLQKHNITMLVDVRSKPSSRFAHFNRDALMRNVRANDIDYRFGGNVLGGMGSVLTTASLFQIKMDNILKLTAEGHRCAMMCSEGKPSECHRAGKLTAWLHRNRTDVETTHIMRNGALIDARDYEPQILPGVIWHEFKDEIMSAKMDLGL